jgi:hypothetical protein
MTLSVFQYFLPCWKELFIFHLITNLYRATFFHNVGTVGIEVTGQIGPRKCDPIHIMLYKYILKMKCR